MLYHIRPNRQKKVRQKCDNKVWLDKMSGNRNCIKWRSIYTKSNIKRYKMTYQASLLIRGPGIRVPSSAPKGRQIAETNGLSSFLFYTVLGACTCDFFKKFRGQRYKNEEDPEELWAERRRELPSRQERSPRRHGAGPLQDEPAAGARVKTSVERRRPTAFRDGGLTVFLFKTGKYWNGKGRNIPYKWRFKSRNLAQCPKLRLGCLTKRR